MGKRANPEGKNGKRAGPGDPRLLQGAGRTWGGEATTDRQKGHKNPELNKREEPRKGSGGPCELNIKKVIPETRSRTEGHSPAKGLLPAERPALPEGDTSQEPLPEIMDRTKPHSYFIS